jgi:predicted exporter
VVQGADLEATLRSAEAVVARIEALVEQGALAGVDSVTRWLPSQQTQTARLASLPDATKLKSELAGALQGGPLNVDRLSPFIAEVQKARGLAPITLADLQGTALKPVIDAMLLQRADKSWVALLPLQPAGDKLDLAAVKAALKDLPGTQTLEIGAELTRLYARYLGEAQAQALLGALGVVALVALTLRSWRRVVAVCQPLLLSVVLTMGALAALGTPLGILHLVGLLLVVAVGSNYALFFDMLQRDTQLDAAAMQDTLASLLLANLTTVLSFGLIAMSAIPALSAIGRVVAPGALLALLLSAAFVPRQLGVVKNTDVGTQAQAV